MYSLETALAQCDREIEDWQKQKEFLKTIEVDLSPEYQSIFWREHSVWFGGNPRSEEEQLSLINERIRILRKHQNG